MTSPRRHIPLLRKHSAFTLVEVAMSLGIVAFAFTALMGILPVGLNLFRDAIETSVTSRIIQQVGGDMQQSDFDNLSAGGTRVRYFDDQGNELTGMAGALYWAKAKVHSSSQLPGAVGTAPGNTDLARVVLEIAHNPSGTAIIEDSEGYWTKTPSVGITRRSLFVARNSVKSGS